MKTLGRVLIIILAFAIMMGVTYSIVNASGSSNNVPANGARSEFRGEGGGDNGGSGNGFGMIFGLLKNIIIVAVIVALVAFPKNLLQQKRRAVPIRIE